MPYVHVTRAHVAVLSEFQQEALYLPISLDARVSRRDFLFPYEVDRLRSVVVELRNSGELARPNVSVFGSFSRDRRFRDRRLVVLVVEQLERDGIRTKFLESFVVPLLLERHVDQFVLVRYLACQTVSYFLSEVRFRSFVLVRPVSGISARTGSVRVEVNRTSVSLEPVRFLNVAVYRHSHVRRRVGFCLGRQFDFLYLYLRARLVAYRTGVVETERVVSVVDDRHEERPLVVSKRVSVQRRVVASVYRIRQRVPELSRVPRQRVQLQVRAAVRRHRILRERHEQSFRLRVRVVVSVEASFLDDVLRDGSVVVVLRKTVDFRRPRVLVLGVDVVDRQFDRLDRRLEVFLVVDVDRNLLRSFVLMPGIRPRLPHGNARHVVLVRNRPVGKVRHVSVRSVVHVAKVSGRVPEFRLSVSLVAHLTPQVGIGYLRQGVVVRVGHRVRSRNVRQFHLFDLEFVRPPVAALVYAELVLARRYDRHVERSRRPVDEVASVYVVRVALILYHLIRVSAMDGIELDVLIVVRVLEAVGRESDEHADGFSVDRFVVLDRSFDVSVLGEASVVVAFRKSGHRRVPFVVRHGVVDGKRLRRDDRLVVEYVVDVDRNRFRPGVLMSRVRPNLVYRQVRLFDFVHERRRVRRRGRQNSVVRVAVQIRTRHVALAVPPVQIVHVVCARVVPRLSLLPRHRTAGVRNRIAFDFVRRKFDLFDLYGVHRRGTARIYAERIDSVLLYRNEDAVVQRFEILLVQISVRVVVVHSRIPVRIAVVSMRQIHGIYLNVVLSVLRSVVYGTSPVARQGVARERDVHSGRLLVRFLVTVDRRLLDSVFGEASVVVESRKTLDDAFPFVVRRGVVRGQRLRRDDRFVVENVVDLELYGFGSFVLVSGVGPNLVYRKSDFVRLVQNRRAFDVGRVRDAVVLDSDVSRLSRQVDVRRAGDRRVVRPRVQVVSVVTSVMDFVVVGRREADALYRRLRFRREAHVHEEFVIVVVYGDEHRPSRYPAAAHVRRRRRVDVASGMVLITVVDSVGDVVVPYRVELIRRRVRASVGAGIRVLGERHEKPRRLLPDSRRVSFRFAFAYAVPRRSSVVVEFRKSFGDSVPFVVRRRVVDRQGLRRHDSLVVENVVYLELDGFRSVVSVSEVGPNLAYRNFRFRVDVRDFVHFVLVSVERVRGARRGRRRDFEFRHLVPDERRSGLILQLRVRRRLAHDVPVPVHGNDTLHLDVRVLRRVVQRQIESRRLVVQHRNVHGLARNRVVVQRIVG